MRLHPLVGERRIEEHALVFGRLPFSDQWECALPFDLRSEPRAAFGFLQHDVRGEYAASHCEPRLGRSRWALAMLFCTTLPTRHIVVTRIRDARLAFECKPEAPPRNAATG
jgi:hypothetical protein